MGDSLTKQLAQRHGSRRDFLKLGARLGALSALGMLAGCGKDASATPQPSAAPGQAGSRADADIKAILQRRIDQEKQGVGIIVGLIEAQGRRLVSHGALSKEGAQAIDGETVFEIGSITKVFTAALLAEMVES